MSVRIADSCITCGACVWECPTEAIAPGDPRPVVAEDRCTECYGTFGESQCVVVCPAAAIIVRPEPEEVLAQRFHRVLPHDPLANTDIWQRIQEAPAATPHAGRWSSPPTTDAPADDQRTDSALVRDPEVIWDHVDGELLLCHTRTGKFYSLNETGAQVWERIGESIARDTLTGHLRAALVHQDADHGDQSATIRSIEDFLDFLVSTQLVATTPVSADGQQAEQKDH